MAASLQFRPQNRDLRMVMREVDEDLAIYLGIRKVKTEENDNLHFDDDNNESKCAEPQPHSLLETCPAKDDDNCLDLEVERSNHDWLLKQSNMSLLPSPDAEVQDSAATQTNLIDSEDQDIPLKSELDVITASLSESSAPLAAVSGVECSTIVIVRKPSLEEGKPRRNRAITPTARPSLAAKSRPYHASTPTSRPTLLPSSKPLVPQPRSSTPVRPTPRSTTSIPILSKCATRTATPTRKAAAVSVSDRSTSSKIIGSAALKSAATVKSRPSKPLDSLSSSRDADQNLKVSMPKRAASASRGRVGPHSSSSSSSSNEKPRQKSCSPVRVRAPHKNGSKVLSRSRGHDNTDDDVNPVVMGTKMVDRVVNMRKLAPPKQDEYATHENTRKSSHENSGFGRSLSKKSLEMAMRHMDIRPRVPNKSRTSTVATPVSPQTSNSDSSKSSSSCRSSYFSQ